MAVIDEKTAWKILKRCAEDCIQIDSSSLLAIYAIGSLPGGYYRPGQSDIDAILIVKDNSQIIWGDSEEPSESLEKINQKYMDKYKIPKDFGPFPIQESELFPPYIPSKELTTEIARLKLQGKCVYGNFPLKTVPMPTSEDFLKDAQHFEEWWREEFEKTTSWEDMSATACINTILIHLGRFLRIKKRIIEFNKHKLVEMYLESKPPFVNNEILQLVERFLISEKISKEDNEHIIHYTKMLRKQMNTYLGITV